MEEVIVEGSFSQRGQAMSDEELLSLFGTPNGLHIGVQVRRAI